MAAADAAWIREHAFTASMRRTHKSAPAYYYTCACHSGKSGYCEEGTHRRCQPEAQVPGPETWICDRNSMVRGFKEPFAHPTLTITGPRRLTEAAGWLADRACVWRCSCDCHMYGGPVGAQLDLFAGAAA